MKGFLTGNMIRYVWFHFGLMYDLPEKISNRFVCLKPKESQENFHHKIIFRLSNEELDLNNIKYIGKYPVLFPGNYSQPVSLEHGNLVINYDFLKSSFFLLSGFQEYRNSKRDYLNRFPYTESIQHKLSFTEIPLVNYYFEYLAEQINDFASDNGLPPVRRRNILPRFSFLLSHDIDKIDYYTYNLVVYKTKEWLGITHSPVTKGVSLKELLKIIRKTVSFRKRENPYWDFDFLLEKEKENHIPATYYFLPRGRKNIDSSYSLSENRVMTLIKRIIDEGHEIGIHGTVDSATDSDILRKNIEQLQKVTKTRVSGIRQHRLMFSVPETARIQKECGLVYDNTLLFANHEGFRNSFCFPFKLYDFEKDHIIDHWMIPLNIMDSTLFDYRNLDFQEAFSSINKIIEQIKYFHGTLSLLWHNGYFDETRNQKGLRDFYSSLLNYIKGLDPLMLPAEKIITDYFNKTTPQ